VDCSITLGLELLVENTNNGGGNCWWKNISTLNCWWKTPTMAAGIVGGKISVHKIVGGKHQRWRRKTPTMVVENTNNGSGNTKNSNEA